MTSNTVVVLAVTGSMIVAAMPRAASQSVHQDVASALLGEVRLLRTTIEHVVTAGAGGQLILGRLQIQEHRVNASFDRLKKTQDELSMMRDRKEEIEQQVVDYEQALASAPRRRAGHVHHELDQESLQEVIERAKSTLAESVDDIRRLSAEETARASELAAEQAAWAELNRRLDDAERLLVRKR